MAVVWPVSLPQNALLGGSGGPDENAKLTTDVAVGRQRQRSRYSDPSEFYDVTVLLESLSQLQDFETFFYETLECGTLEFDWTHPDDETVPVTCAIVGMFKKSCEVPNKVYRVSFQLEILP